MLGIIGLIAGIVAGAALSLLVGFIGTSIYPYPAEIDLQDVSRTGEAFATTGLGYRLFVVLAWFASAFGGGVVAKLVSGQLWPLWGTTAVMTLNALATIFVLPLPVWMQIASVVVTVAGGFLATHVGRGRGSAGGADG